MSKSPLFSSTSDEKPSLLTISFAKDPGGSLGTQLINLDKGQTRDMFCPGYASVGRIVEGETVARKCGVAVGDIIVAVNGEGFRRFKSNYNETDLEDLTAKIDGILVPNSNGEAKELKMKVIAGMKDGEHYTALLNKIKAVKKAADPNNPLVLSLERYAWDSEVNSWHRFLVARDGDVPAAMKMRQQHETWREAMFPIDLTDPGLQEVIDAKAVSEIDVKHKGLPPTVYVNFSRLQALETNHTAQDVVKAFVIFTETVLKRSSDSRSPQMSQLIDLTGVSVTSGFRTDILKEVYTAFEPNYPETLHKMIMYPVSKYVASTANLMLGFVNEKTRKKFIITDDLSIVCENLGWSQEEVEYCGGVSDFMTKHAKSGDSLLMSQ